MSKSESGRVATGESVKTRQILDAARRLFTCHGYRSVSMDSIARAADVSKATVYAHFASKEALFRAMVQRQCQYCTRHMSVAREADPNAVEAALRSLGYNYLHTIMQPEIVAVFRLLIAETVHMPALGKDFYQAGPAITLAGIAAYLDRAVHLRKLDLQDSRLAAAQFLGMLKSDLQMRALLGIEGRDNAAIEATVEAAVAAFMRAHAPRA